MAVVGAFGPVRSIVLGLADAAAYERAYRERQLALGSVPSMRRAGVRLLIMAVLFGYAFDRAALPYLWALAAFIVAVLGLIAFSVSLTRIARSQQFEGTPPSEVPDAGLASSRRRTQVGQALYVVLWLGCWYPQLRLAG